MKVYYNENERFCVEWLKNLISAGEIPPGEVDARDIRDVRPSDLAGFDQHHFFAGIGVWARAARDAEWTGPLWTGSCPCQPFSSAGKGAGFADERHLWPYWHWLIEQCAPFALAGEQVASPHGYTWLDLVQADLEGSNYTSGALVAPIAGFGAPHGRHRLYWMAYALHAGRPQGRTFTRDGQTAGSGSFSTVADNNEPRFQARQRETTTESRGFAITYECGPACPVADDNGWRFGRFPNGERGERDGGARRWPEGDSSLEPCRPVNGFWRDAYWLECLDGKARPVGPGIFPLAHGATQRVGRLRGYGNAVALPQATAFLRAFKELV